MSVVQMTNLDLFGKRVLIRADLNVPIRNGEITNDTRIRAFLPTIEIALKKGARIMVASHLGRPIEGEYSEEFSLFPIANYLKSKLPSRVRFVRNYLDGVEIFPNEVVILENVRFNKGERQDIEEILAKKYAAICDIFVMDAFGVAHRKEASTHGVSKFVKTACAGPLLMKELEMLNNALKDPERPVVAIVGGSKISTKLNTLSSLAKVADRLIVGGGIANTFIAAKGYNVGKSIQEPNLIDEAKRLLDITDILIPHDVRVSTKFSKDAPAFLKTLDEIKNEDRILDFGDSSIKKVSEIIKTAKTILWNGPIGVFEFQNFRKGTEVIANTIAASDAFSIAGGGDTIAAIDLFGVSNKISYISTGGGAFIKFIEERTLPSIAVLEKFAEK